jgi:hypothetical protein
MPTQKASLPESARFSSFWRDLGKQQQPRTARSCQWLVHRWFDTLDLKEAKALLDELT